MGRGPVNSHWAANQQQLQQLQQQMLANAAAQNTNPYYNNAQVQSQISASQLQQYMVTNGQIGLGYAASASATVTTTKRIVRPLAVSYDCVSDLLGAAGSATGDVITLSVIAKPNLEWLKHLIQRRR